MALESGTQLGHYEITDPLGKGGMGEVYRARDTKLGREVAIKVLPAELSQDPERVTRLEREARMLALLNHPNIGSIYGLEQSEDTRFLVLELVEGDTLADRLKRGALPVADSLELALQIAEALEAAHEKGVIHRDLKPANIKITPDGTVKVLDFGLAKALIGDQAEVDLSNSPTLSMAATRAGIVLGTAAYMAPEQASGEIADHRADVWAFGVVLFEMLTGQPLFTGKTASHIMGAVLNIQPDWNRLPANLNPRVRMLLERSLEKEPKDRLSGISDARVEIQRVLDDPRGVIVPTATAAERSSLRTTLTWAAALVIAATVTGVLAWSLKPEAPLPVVRAVISPLDSPPALRTGRDIAISPDGTQVAYMTVTDGSASVVLRDIDQLDASVLSGAELPYDLFYAPDGDSLGFSTANGALLQSISTQGGPTVSLAGLLGNPTGASWGDDNAVVFSNQGNGLRRVSGVGGEPEQLTTATGVENHFWPEVLPGAKAVLFTLFTLDSGGDGQVAVLDLQTMEQKVLIPSGSAARYASSGHLVYAVGDTLWAVGFDPGTLQVLGDPAPVLEGVAARVTTGDSAFDISDNGSLAYITQVGPVGGAANTDGNLNLTVFDRDGTSRVLEAPTRPYRSPRVSPDGTQIAVEILEGNQSSIWVYDIGGGAAIRRLTQVTEGNNTRPVWTPDGTRITFASDRDGAQSIYWQPADGSGPAERLTTAEEGTMHFPESWSPDGVLSFGLTTGGPGAGNWEIWTRNADGESELFYDLPNLNQFGSAFSPDGRWLAYASGETDTNAANFRVFVGAYPGNSPRYEIVGDGASWPVWSPDGTKLYYRLATGGGRPTTLRNVSIAVDPVFRFTREETLFLQGFSVFQNYRDYDPFPDSDEFLMLTPADAPAVTTGAAPDAPQPEVVLIQNFFEILNDIVPLD